MREKNKKLPDSVVFNQETGKYDSFSKEYPVSLSSPKIEVPDISLFRSGAVTKANKKFQKRAEEIREQIKSLMDEFMDNEMIWSVGISFEPTVGTEIYLYEKQNGERFSSLISPEEWNGKFKFIGNFKLDSDFSWRRI